MKSKVRVQSLPAGRKGQVVTADIWGVVVALATLGGVASPLDTHSSPGVASSADKRDLDPKKPATSKENRAAADVCRVPPSRILLVDDDAVSIEVIAAKLRDAGFETLVHTSGFGFATKVRRFRPDVVILDLEMPGLKGEAAVGILEDLSDRWGIPSPEVVIYSGHPPEVLAQVGAKIGAAAWICKTERVAALLSTVQDIAARLMTGS